MSESNTTVVQSMGRCSVCYNRLYQDLQVTCCGHVYHKKCISQLRKSRDLACCSECGYKIDYEHFMDKLSDFVPDPKILNTPTFSHQMLNLKRSIKICDDTNILSIPIIDNYQLERKFRNMNLCKNRPQTCIIYKNSYIKIINKQHLCNNCCMKLLMVTDSLKAIYAANYKTQSHSYLLTINQLMMHPQIVCYFSSNKHLYKFALEMIIEAAWFSDVQINHIYTMSSRKSGNARNCMRLAFCYLVEMCQNKRQLLTLIQLKGGKYFDACILGYLRDMPRFFEMMSKNQKHCSDKQYESWCATNRWAFVAYHIAVKIVYKYGNYFWNKACRHSFRKGNKILFKGCYNYLAKLFGLLPQFQKCHQEWVKYAFDDKQLHSKQKSFKYLMFNYQKNVCCNNSQCNIKYGDYVYPFTPEINKLPAVFQLLKADKTWYKCGNCKLVWYCSRKCQKYDWNKFSHKKLCCYF
eukprot:426092_1